MADYTITSSNGGTWTIQSTNTAKVGRGHDLALLAQGASGPNNVFTKARSGFLPSPQWQDGVITQGGGQVFSASGLNFSITPFAAIVDRSSLVYPYLVISTAVGSASLTTADPSQTTIYRVDLQVLDGILGDNGGTDLTSIKVTRGTPGAGTPTAPSNSTPVGIWTVPANTTQLTSGMWTDTRRSSALAGAVRMLQQGDALADAGFMVGELRDTGSIQSGGSTIDRWNAATAAWELLIPLPGQHEVDYLASAPALPTNHVHAMPWTTIIKSSADITLSQGGPDNVPNGILTFNRSGLWQVGIQFDCPIPQSNTQFTSFRVRQPNDTGTIVFGSGGNPVLSDGGPVRVTAGTTWSVIVVQQTGATQATTARFRAALLRG